MAQIPRQMSSPLWVVPFGFGGVIFSFGILIWQFPDLLRFIVAASFCAFGFMVMAFAWKLRPGGGRGGGAGGAARRGGNGASYVQFEVERDEESR